MGFEWLLGVWAVLRGVEPYEVMQALYAVRRRPVPATAAGFAVLAVWGRTRAGRALVIVLRHKTGRDWWIVTAREMTEVEKIEFTQWEEADGDDQRDD